jgi:hypothetical protein
LTIIITTIWKDTTSLEIKISCGKDREIIPAMQACNDDFLKVLVDSLTDLILIVSSKHYCSIVATSKSEQ